MTTANIVLSARDTTKAAFASLDASLRGAGQRLDALNGTVQGFLGLGAVAVFTAGLRGAVNELDRLGDTAPKIGLTTQSLAELGFAAKLSGTDAATLEGAIGKLSTRMADAAGGSKEAAAVFSALGIKVKDATGSLKSGDVVLGEIADKFSTFTDGPERAALAVEIFGKSGRELIPLLTQGSKGIDGLRSEFRALAGDDLGAAAQAAGLFNDSLDRLQTSTGRFSRQILEATLPTLTDLVNGLVTTEKSTRDVNVVAEALATVLETVSVVGANVSYVIKQVGNEIGGLAAQAVALATLDLNGFKAIGEAMKADAKSAREAVDAYSAGVLRARELATTLAGIDKSYQALENRRLGGGSASPTQTAPIISKPTTEAQTAYKSISAELEKQAKLLAAQSELGRNLTDGEKFRIDIIERITSEATKLTASERAALLIQAERVANLKDEEELRQKNVKLAQQAYAAEVEFEEERARAEVEASRARESARTYVQDILLATEEQTRLLELEAGLVNATEQQRGFALEKLRIELQLRKDILEVQRRLQFDAVAQQEAIDQLNADAQAKIANAQKRSILDEFNRTTAQISDSLTDALLRGFESGKGFVRNFVDTLKNLFKTLVLTPTIKAIIQPVAGALTGAFGLNGVANAGGIDSVFGAASNVASIANLTTSVSSLVTIGSQVASGAMSVANALGTVFANSTGTGISGLLATNGAFGTAAAGSTAATTSSALSSAAAAGPYVLAAVAALNALGVFRSRKIVDGGLQGELGGQINDYALERRGGTLFNGPSYRVLDRGVSAQNDELQKAYSAIRTTVAGMAEQLGIGNDAIKAFTVQLGNDLIHPDTGGFGIKTQGLTQDEIVKKIEAALVSANEQLAAFALGTTEFTRNGETAAQTLGRLAGSLQTVNSTFDLLGLTLADASLAGADAASKFVDLFGGVEQFGQVTSSYYANFYTEAERTANTVEALRQRFYELGVNGATTREEFRAMVEEQQRLHGATSPVVAELLKLSDTFASVVPAVEAVTKSTQQMVQAQQQADAALERSARLAAQRAEQQRRLDERNSALESINSIEQGLTDALTPLSEQIPEFLTSFDQLRDLANSGLGFTSEQLSRWAQGLADLRRESAGALSEFSDVVRQFREGLTPYGQRTTSAGSPEAADSFFFTTTVSAFRELNRFLKDELPANTGSATDRLRLLVNTFNEAQRAGVTGAAGSSQERQDQLNQLGVAQTYQQLLERLGETFAEVARTSLPEALAMLQRLPGGVEQLVTLFDDAGNAIGGAVQGFNLREHLLEIINAAAEGGAVAGAANDIAQERIRLENELLQLQGDTVEIRRREREAINESNLALYDQIQALRDQQQAAAEAARIASERDGLERRLLQAQGNTIALRQLEIDALDESNRALLLQIFALEDQAAAAQAAEAAAREAQQAQEEAARQAEQARNDIQSSLRGMFEFGQDLLRQINDIRRQARDNLTQARSGVVGALDTLAAASQSAAERLADAQQAAANELRDSMRQVADSVGAYLRELAGTSTGSGSIFQQRDFNGAQFQDLAARALAGDTTAGAQVTDAARSYIESLRQTSTSTLDFAREELRIRAQLAQIQDLNAVATGGQTEALTALQQAERDSIQAARDYADAVEAATAAGIEYTETFRTNTTDFNESLAAFIEAQRVANEVQASLLAEEETLVEQYARLTLELEDFQNRTGDLLDGFNGKVDELGQLLTQYGEAIAALAAAASRGGGASVSPSPMPNNPTQNTGGTSVNDVAIGGLTGIATRDPNTGRIEFNVNTFANGGFYPGGMALVGERGPELINFANPGQVYTADQTRSLMGGDTSRMEAQMERMTNELMTLRRELQDIKTNTGDTKTILRRVTQDGDAITTVPA